MKIQLPWITSFVLFTLSLIFSAGAFAGTALVFTGSPVESGSGVGQTARWTNVGTIDGVTINIELEVIALTGGSSIDFGTSSDDAFFGLSPGTALSEVTMAYKFFDASNGDGFTTALTILPDAGFMDIDSDGNETVILQSSEVASYTLESATSLSVNNSGGDFIVTSNAVGNSSSNINIQVQFQPTTALSVIYRINDQEGRRVLAFDGDVDLVFNTPDVTQLDTTPPAVPTVVSQTTNDITPTLTGTAEAFTTVTVVVGGATFEVLADASGNWSVDTSATPVSGTFNPNVNGTNEVVVTSTDAAGNSTNDGSATELTIDSTAPTVDIQNAPATVNSLTPYTVTFQFSENVTGFDVSDITVVNGTADGFAGSGSSYTADITPNGAGDITIDVAAAAAQDAATNDNVAATQVVTSFDATAPTVVIQNAPAFANSLAPYTVTFQFSENVTGFDVSDITVGNGAAGGFAGSGSSYTADITPNGAGNISIDVAAAVAQDAATNDNVAATQVVTTYDAVSPTVAIQDAPAIVNSIAPYTVTFQFSENVTGFAVGDITVTNGAAGNLSGSGSTYTADITPDGNGDITINVAAGVAQDVAANGNTAATAVVTSFDAGAPSVVIQNAPVEVTETTAYTVTFEFSEDVTGFDASDITVTNGTVANFSGSGTTYTADITPDGNGDISISVADSVAQDTAGNDNVAASAVTTTLVTDGDNDGIPDRLECPAGPPFDATCQDSDGDGTPDYLDSDSDNDGVPDAVEAGATPSTPVDSDNDGTPDFLDPDSDADGIPDSLEAGNNPAIPADTDGDGTVDYLDLDSDGDGIPDVTEDDVSTGVDSDNDGIDDGYDVDATNGTDSNSNGVDDAVTATDTDQDGFADYIDLDSDRDGIPDQLEAGYDASGVDFTQDVDRDGIPDDMDADASAGADTDNNGILDSLEPVNTDDDAMGIADYRDLDSDNDGILDVAEAGLTDADEDGLVDGNDANGDGIVDVGAATDPVQDSDNDGLPDYTDLESTNENNDGTDFDIANNPVAERDDANGDGIVDDATDTDGDGIVDSVDNAPGLFGSIPPFPDADFDGIPDDVEGTGDTDGDGTPDFQDTDSDNDGVPDHEEAGLDATNPVDTDNDGTPDYIDNDSDNDGLPDALEAGANPLSPVDSDGDGIPDMQDRDSDNDSIPDAIENTGASGSDSDSDGIDDIFDVDVTGGVDANNDGVDDDVAAADADADSTPNYLDLDSDGDSIPDVLEDDTPDAADADSDGIDDAYDVDVTGGSDANSDGVDDAVAATDSDGDGISDYLDLDSDSDGIPDEIEAGYDASAVNFAQDTDGDGIPDGMDADVASGDDEDSNGFVDQLQPVNTDDDLLGIADFRDLDSDNDSLLDTAEAGLTDADEDGRVDGDDANGDGIVDAGAATAPLLDTDNDNLADYVDLESSNPANDASGPFDVASNPDASGLDADNDGIIDDAADLDSDGIQDVVDRAPNFFGASGDADNDGVSDAEEIGADPNNPLDTDGDGIPDFQDTDSDNDGFPDALEAVGCPLAIDTGDCDNDGIADRLQADDLETAVTGVGSMGLLSLLMLLPLFIRRFSGRQNALLPAVLVLLVSGSLLTSNQATAHEEFYAGRDVVKSEQSLYKKYDVASDGDRGSLLEQNNLFFYPGWYAGVGAGTTTVDPEGNANGFETDDSGSSGFKIYFGRHFRPNWSWEISYADLGVAGLNNPTRPALFDAVSSDVGTPEIDYKVPAGWILYHVREPNEDFNVYAKAGLSFISNDSNDPRIGFDKQSSVQLALGLGLQWRFSDRFFTRLELDSYDRDANYAGLSVGMYFGGHKTHVMAKPAADATPLTTAAKQEKDSVIATPATQAVPVVALESDICEAFSNAVKGVNFKTNSAELKEASRNSLRKLGLSLTAYPDVVIDIQAHTDSDGSAQYNQTLSEKRAQSVMRYLVGLGLDAERMSATGHGETLPIADNGTREGKAMNRRVEFVPIGAACQ